MKNTGYILLAALCASLLCSLLLSGCKKYPEGGYKFQAKSLIQGEKELILYTVDGIDSLQYLFDTEFCGCDSRKFNFYIKPSSGSHILPYIHSCQGQTENDEWYLSDKKDSLILIFGYTCNSITHYPFYKDKKWKILKLDKEEMLLTTTQLGKTYEMLFKSL